MDEIDKRLREAAEGCIKAYETWAKSRKNFEAREALQEAVHELRKVSARLEIEMAASERDEMAQRPIPIPSHRASRARPNEAGNDLPDFVTEGGNAGGDEDAIGNSVAGSEGGQSRPPQRSQGRMGHHQRRPMRRPQDNSE